MTHEFPTYQIKGRTVEYKTVSFQVKSIDQKLGIVTGLASPVTNIDRQKDTVESGAYTKTLSEGQLRMQNGRRFMMACLWMHDPTQPTGGVIAGQELTDGLEVTMKYDISVNSAGIPNNSIATMVFSGFDQGYIDELSIGYVAIKYDYDKQGVRHLREVQLVEISAVTMLFAANPEALVPASGVKSMTIQTKSVCGDTSLPIGPRDESWDGSKAEKQIFEYAVKDDGTIDASKAKKCFLQLNGDPTLKGSWGYPFTYIENGSPRIAVGGVKACAGALAGGRGASTEGEDVGGMRKKVETLYSKINKKYPDADQLEATWEDDDKTMKDKPQRKDFNTLLQVAASADCFEDWVDLINVLTQSMIQIFGMGDQPKEDMTACIDQFREAVMAWVDDAVESDLAGYIDDRGYCDSYGGNGPYVPYSARAGGYDYSSRHDAIAGKVGRVLSGANEGTLKQHQADMKDSLDAMGEHMKAMYKSVNDLSGMYSSNQQEDDEQNEDNEKSIRREPRQSLTRNKQPLDTKSTVQNMSLDELAVLIS